MKKKPSPFGYACLDTRESQRSKKMPLLANSIRDFEAKCSVCVCRVKNATFQFVKWCVLTHKVTWPPLILDAMNHDDLIELEAHFSVQTLQNIFGTMVLQG